MPCAPTGWLNYLKIAVIDRANAMMQRDFNLLKGVLCRIWIYV